MAEWHRIVVLVFCTSYYCSSQLILISIYTYNNFHSAHVLIKENILVKIH